MPKPRAVQGQAYTSRSANASVDSFGSPAMAWAIEIRARLALRGMLLELAWLADTTGGVECSIASLARQSIASPRSIRDVLAQLRTIGAIDYTLLHGSRLLRGRLCLETDPETISNHPGAKTYHRRTP